MNKSIGLLTIHHSYNFGAMLQTFATFYLLRKINDNVEIIDYDPHTFFIERKIFLPINSLGNIARNIRSLLNFGKIKKRKTKFEHFYSSFVLSSNKVYSEDDINKLEYKLIVVGSDQTFCLYLTNDVDEMKIYFLNGVRTKKISYASSMGEKNSLLKEKDIEFIKESLIDFHSISVREAKSADIIENLISKRPKIVLDPTLLLKRNDWETLIPKNDSRKEYILFYTVLSSPWVIKYAKEASKFLKLPIIAINQKTRFEFFSGFKYDYSCGPIDFISYIKNAKCIITTSFHATAFSIIFRKDFVSLLCGEGNRLSSLLDSFGMSDRLIKEDWPDLGILKKNIDYDKVENIKNQLIDDSLTYLNNSIGIIDE